VQKQIASNASIEGQKVLVTTRKQVAQGTLFVQNIGLCYKYFCQKNARAVIELELSPKKPLLNPASCLNNGDSVQGQTLDLISDSRLKFAKEANFSSVHGIQTAKTIKFGSAMIRIPFRFVLDKIQQNMVPQIPVSN
jgi:hypothetical protein